MAFTTLQEQLAQARAETQQQRQANLVGQRTKQNTSKVLRLDDCTPLAERFWMNVNKSDSCWIWQGARRSRGHGTFYVNHYPEAAHRVAWVLQTQKDLPANVRLKRLPHNCACNYCVNPNHYTDSSHHTLRQHYQTIDVISAPVSS